jgi:alkanesulfonate monooxygenase SsuD/methylene tetrahydromethanopterin reductase-like flavin-dependent oxidoreductase (luciferase family)
MLGTDLTGLPLDGPLPDLPEERDINGNKSRFTLVAELARRDGLTLRELIARLGGGRGHRVFAGTPEQTADQLEEWFTQGAADGFNIMPPHLPGGLEDFVDHVVPILQRRGLFRTEYTGRTLREHYGLARPANRLAAPVTADGKSV